MINDILSDLIEALCVEDEDGVTLSPTVNGRIASYYYLSYKTVELLATRLGGIYNSEESDFVGMMLLLCDVPEYDELPVRHNGILLVII